MNKISQALSIGFLGLLLGACNYQVNTSSTLKTESASAQGDIKISDLSKRSANATQITAKELGYDWRYPKYPDDYKINLDNRDPNNGSYMSNRQAVYQKSVEVAQQPTSLGPLGSYAGPWIEGEEGKLLPVANPNIPLGEAILKVIGNEITPEMKPTLDESPFQEFLKIRNLSTDSSGKLRTITIELPATNPATKNVEPAQYDIQLDKEALWSVAMTLYKQLIPDWTVKVPLKSDPASQTNPKKQKDGAGVFGNCNMCHGADGWGLGHSGLKLQPPPANFHETRRLLNRSETHLRQVLHNGIYGSAMPPWGDKLGDAEIAAVVSYLRHYTYSTEIPVLSALPRFKGQ